MRLTIIFLLILSEYYKDGLFFEKEQRALIPLYNLRD
jgi:hypothetical protein